MMILMETIDISDFVLEVFQKLTYAEQLLGTKVHKALVIAPSLEFSPFIVQ